MTIGRTASAGMLAAVIVAGAPSNVPAQPGTADCGVVRTAGRAATATKYSRATSFSMARATTRKALRRDFPKRMRVRSPVTRKLYTMRRQKPYRTNGKTTVFYTGKGRNGSHIAVLVIER